MRGDAAVAAIADSRGAGRSLLEAIAEYANAAGAPMVSRVFTFNAIGNAVTSSEDTPARMIAAYETWDTPIVEKEVDASDASITRVYGRVTDRPLVKAARHGRADVKPEGTAARCGACAAPRAPFLCTGCRAATYCNTSPPRALISLFLGELAPTGNKPSWKWIFDWWMAA